MRGQKGASSEQATPAASQHTRPCADCPWAREALRGWLGSLTPDEWIQVGHGDQVVPCHVHPNQQCAGLAIYRRNVAKLPRGGALVLEADRTACFANPQEFLDHHRRRME